MGGGGLVLKEDQLSIKIRKVARKSDHSLFINLFFNSLKKDRKIHLFLGPHYSLFIICLAHYSLFIIKRVIIH